MQSRAGGDPARNRARARDPEALAATIGALPGRVRGGAISPLTHESIG
jgi:hypothetical protein